MKLSEHFDSKEFLCKCGCGLGIDNPKLIERLERLRTLLGDTPIEIVSGRRCPTHSVSVGGYANDMHVLGGAVDIRCYPHNAYTICEQAEKCGFGGIALISDTNVHLDCRDFMEYYDSKGNRLVKWFGNEMTNQTYSTFEGMGEKIETKASREIKVLLEYEGHKYSGLLTEE